MSISFYTQWQSGVLGCVQKAKFHVTCHISLSPVIYHCLFDDWHKGFIFTSTKGTIPNVLQQLSAPLWELSVYCTHVSKYHKSSLTSFPFKLSRKSKGHFQTKYLVGNSSFLYCCYWDKTCLKMTSSFQERTQTVISVFQLDSSKEAFLK